MTSNPSLPLDSLAGKAQPVHGSATGEHSTTLNRGRPRYIRRFILFCFACAALQLVWRGRPRLSRLSQPSLSLPEHLANEDSEKPDWQPSILSPHGFAVELPQQSLCLGAENPWVVEPNGDASPGRQSAVDEDLALDTHALRARSRIEFRQGVRNVYIDTGVRKTGLNVMLHVATGPLDRATVDVDAFYDRADALTPIRACAYRADLTRETPGESERIDLFRLQRRRRSIRHEAPVWLNVTLTIPANHQSYQVKVDAGWIMDVSVHEDVELETLHVLNSGAPVNGYPPTMGKLEARQGFTARKVDVKSLDISGHFRADEYIRMGAAFNAPMNVHVDAVRAKGRSPPSVMLSSFNGELNATVRLVDPEPNRPGIFDINGLTMGGPLNITLTESAPYSAVTISARAEGADAHVRLDERFEGNFVTRALEPSQNTEAQVTATTWTIDDSTRDEFRATKTISYWKRLPHELSGTIMWDVNPWGFPYNGRPDASGITVQSVGGSAYIET
ncbi:hypothetical protein PENSPDRAFT_691123 [Peniophora sp. CONT]|nr:hypothetical protein PENSPDRAFT_691123 [Peniophora sp. CONT]